MEDETADTDRQKPSDGDGPAVAYGMIAGMMTGIIFGFIMNNIALGVAIGTGLGIALGAGFSETKRPK